MHNVALPSESTRKWGHRFTLIALGASIGVLGWDYFEVFLSLVLLVPFAVLGIPNRSDRLCFVLAYWIAASWPVAFAAKGFFFQSSIFWGVVLLALSSLAQVSPYLFIRTRNKATGVARQGSDFLLTCFLMILNLLPGLGYFAWSNPLYAYGLFSNHFEIALGLASLICFWWFDSTIGRLCCVTLVLILGVTGSIPTMNHGEADTLSLGTLRLATYSTHYGGPMPGNAVDRGARFLDILSAHNTRVGHGTVSVWPENIIGPLRTDDIQDLSRLMPKINPAPLFVGASILQRPGEYSNALIDPFTGHYLTARVPMLIGNYRPWSKTENFPISLFKTNVVQIDGQKIQFLFCAEEYMPFVVITGFEFGHPKAIVSVSNVWWSDGIDEIAQRQEIHARLLAKILGVPIVRSVEYGQKDVVRADHE